MWNCLFFINQDSFLFFCISQCILIQEWLDICAGNKAEAQRKSISHGSAAWAFCETSCFVFLWRKKLIHVWERDRIDMFGWMLSSRFNLRFLSWFSCGSFRPSAAVRSTTTLWSRRRSASAFGPRCWTSPFPWTSSTACTRWRRSSKSSGRFERVEWESRYGLYLVLKYCRPSVSIHSEGSCVSIIWSSSHGFDWLSKTFSISRRSQAWRFFTHSSMFTVFSRTRTMFSYIQFSSRIESWMFLVHCPTGKPLNLAGHWH